MFLLLKEKYTLESMLKNSVYGRNALFVKNRELKKADKYIKRVFPNAEFYVDYESVLVFQRIDEDKEIDLDNHTVINGIAYNAAFTNSHKDLVEFYDEAEIKNDKENKSEVFTCNGKKYEQETWF